MRHKTFLIHNHIIVNNVNFYTGHTFETENNQGKIPDCAWSKLRTISDELCRKHELSIIENPQLSKGKSHWEWELDKQNLSWKEQLKRTIDEVNEMTADNSTIEELESAAHRALAKFTISSAPMFSMSNRLHEIDEQISVIEKFNKFHPYHKQYVSLEGKEKTKYKSDFCHELDEYTNAYKKLIELFPDGHIPKLSKLKTELEKARTDYAQQSAERKALKKEADRLSRLAQQKRDSQRTVQRYLQNEQAAKRKKGQLE